jgi:hypothetical protein
MATLFTMKSLPHDSYEVYYVYIHVGMRGSDEG